MISLGFYIGAHIYERNKTTTKDYYILRVDKSSLSEVYLDPKHSVFLLPRILTIQSHSFITDILRTFRKVGRNRIWIIYYRTIY